MGWNSAYTIMEATVIGAYDLGKLDKELLLVLVEPYRGTDIDHGGSCGLKAKDGLDVSEVIVTVMGGTLPKRPKGKRWSDRESERYYDELCDECRRFERDVFGWG